MKNKLVIIFCILLCSCKALKVQDQKKFIKDKAKTDWIFAFKSTVFYECFKQSGVKIEKDASPSLNFQTLGDFKILYKTDSIGKSYSKIIKERSVWLSSGDLDGYNALTNGCLSFFESKELDSIAKKEYQKYVKGE